MSKTPITFPKLHGELSSFQEFPKGNLLLDK